MRHRFVGIVMSWAIACGAPPMASSPSVVKIGAIDTDASADGDRIPKGWSVDAMVTRESDSDRPLESRILMWRIREDARPLYVETAIVWARMPKSWLLLYVYRHPREPGENEWRLAIVADSPITPLQRFTSAPTSAEAKRFIEASAWTDTSTDFKQLGAAVCARAWKSATGEAFE